ncbi:MAG: peptide-methionine (S)-S-oxide reductase MsrA [Acidimicrobiia bacterium]|nr:peptide-methionine (S)-S-oxide reductase MsrA [Acidimicrobiia bacterium]
MIFGQTSRKTDMVDERLALEGRDQPLDVQDGHVVLGTSFFPPFPDGTEVIYFGMGCFWGAERIFWQVPGVHTTAVGYAGGYTPNPTYEEVCTGRTGHNEVAMVVFDPDEVSYDDLFEQFWEQHDPTQGMRQGNDVGTQYRSAIYYTTDEQRAAAEASLERYQQRLDEAGYAAITTEIEEAGPFFHAETYHQQYLAKNPNGYCNHGFCQVSYDG